jgi:Caspase domain
MKSGCAAAMVWLCCMLSSVPLFAQTQRALLIGINTYEPAGTSATHPPGCVYGRCELGHFENLDGAVNDVQSMADLLTSPKFGFPASQIVLLTTPHPAHPVPGLVLLPADQTTHDGILAAMQKYLVDVPQRGDTVVFYAASHGSLRINSKGNKLTVLVNGQYVHADSTLVPSDAYKGGYDVRDREMTRIFNAALDKGIHLTIIFDNCHSGGIARGISPKYRERDLPFDARDIAEPPPVLANGEEPPPPTQRSDNPALVLAAVQQDQSSKEMPDTNPPTESHGAFTAALVEALQVLPADTPASIVYQRVRAVIGNEDVPDEDPDLDTTAQRREQPLFGGAAAASANLRTAVVGTAGNGNVWLDIGRVSGIGPGTEFSSTNNSGQNVELRVTALDGIARSIATIVNPSGAIVKPGDIFELSKWSPVQSPPLHVWHWPATLSQADILAAAAQIQTASVTTVSDPAEESWTHMLSWDGTNWTLQQAGAPSPVPLGSTLTAAALKKIPGNAKIWVNLPPSRELQAQLLPADPNSAVQVAANLANAEYALTGVLTAQGPSWAWFHKNELAAGPPPPNAPPHTPGCSPTSPYPVRSDWIAMPDAAAIEQGAATLNHYASLLAKVHGWLEMTNSPADASRASWYSLAVMPASGRAPIMGEKHFRQGDLFKLGLQSSNEVTEKRWVYVLDIDCQGKGTVVYPRGNTNNQFPNESDIGTQFVLPGPSTLRILKPFGVDTFVMLSTTQQLSDPFILNFEGVAPSRGAQSPLEQLLRNTSSATRGDPGRVPTDWGVGLTTIHSVPQPAQ